MPLLQKALDDPALEVVVEAAEDSRYAGRREAGPGADGIAPSSVRNGAASGGAGVSNAVAEPTVLPGLLDALDDSCATVRFNLVGALAHAAGDSTRLSEEQRKRLLKRLEALVQRDSDLGRSQPSRERAG